MYANIVYKETFAQDNKTLLKVDIIEADEDESNASKYSRLYALQLPQEDKSRVYFRTIQMKIN